MNNSIKMELLKDAISDTLKLYNEEITEEVKNIAKEVKDELVKNTKKDAPIRTGNYKKNITSVKTSESKRHVTYTWYVKDPEYRLSHLIAHGHRLKNGKKSRKNDFIEKNEKEAVNNYIKRVEGVVKR